MSKVLKDYATERQLTKAVRRLQELDISQIGSEPWLQQFESIECMMRDVNSNISKLNGIFLENGKVKVLIYLITAGQLWRRKVLPTLRDYASQRGGAGFYEFTRDACEVMLDQEDTAVTLLSYLLMNASTVHSLGNYALDVIDYCTSDINLLVPKNRDFVDFLVDCMMADNIRQAQLKMLINGLTMIGLLAKHADQLNVSAVVRMYDTEDVPLLVAELLEKHFWKRQTSQGWEYENKGSWSTTVSDEATKIETLGWGILSDLLMQPLVLQHYVLTPNRISALQKLQNTEVVADHLAEIKKSVMEGLSTMKALILPYQSAIIVETDPPITRILLNKGDEYITLTHVTIRNFNEKSRCLQMLRNNQEEMTLFLKMFYSDNKCTNCNLTANFLTITKMCLYCDSKARCSNGKLKTPQEMSQQASTSGQQPTSVLKCNNCENTDSAMKKCGRCHNVHYCSKECQSWDWLKHKLTCAPKKKLTGGTKAPIKK